MDQECFICLENVSADGMRCATCRLHYHSNCMIQYLKSSYTMHADITRDPGRCPQCNAMFETQFMCGICNFSLGQYTSLLPFCVYLSLWMLFILAIVGFESCVMCSCTVRLGVALMILPMVGMSIYCVNKHMWVRSSDEPVLF